MIGCKDWTAGQLGVRCRDAVVASHGRAVRRDEVAATLRAVHRVKLY